MSMLVQIYAWEHEVVLNLFKVNKDARRMPKIVNFGHIPTFTY